MAATPFGVDLVQPSGADRPVQDQARLLEHPQVLRDRRTADGQEPRELPNRGRPLDEQLEDGAPRRVTERRKSILVSLHEP
jgi:hypothetical protein